MTDSKAQAQPGANSAAKLAKVNRMLPAMPLDAMAFGYWSGEQGGAGSMRYPLLALHRRAAR